MTVEALILRKEIDHEHCRVFVEMVAVEEDAQGNEVARGGLAHFYLDCGSGSVDVSSWITQNKKDVIARFKAFRKHASALEKIG